MTETECTSVLTHKRHPIAHPSGWAMGCLCVGFGENWPHYTAPYCNMSVVISTHGIELACMECFIPCHGRINSLWHSDAIWGQTWVDFWLWLWLVAWQHQGIIWTNGNCSSMKFFCIHMRAISQEMLSISILDVSLKITNLRLRLHLSGDNELTLCTFRTLFDTFHSFPS